jgi:NADH-quinone oxidoreductase subunit E
MEDSELTALLAPMRARPEEIIRALQEIQAHYGYIPKGALREAARQCGVAYSYAYSIATFYKAFSLHERGRYVIRVCDGTACHLKLSGEIREELTEVLGIGEEETTEDGLFSIEMVNCLGACAMAPVVSINETLFGSLTRTKVRELIEDIRNRGEEALQ